MVFDNILNKKQITEVFDIFTQNNPTPRIELEYVNPFTLLIAVILSAQATDVSVNKATKLLFCTHNEPEHFVALGVSGIENAIKSIGLYRSKARYIFDTSYILMTEYSSIVPHTLEQLTKLPGVGLKTANIVLNSAFGMPTIGVDRHVFRVINRIGIAKTPNILKTMQILPDIIPKNYHKYAHHWLVLHGRYVCLARKPLCASCSLSNLCVHYAATKKATT